MRKRLAAVGLGLALGTNGAAAQQPLVPIPPLPNSAPYLPTLPPLPGSPQLALPQPPRAPDLLPPLNPAAPQMQFPPGAQPPGGLVPQVPPQMRLTPSQGLTPTNVQPVQKPAAIGEMPLPYPERKQPFSAQDVSVKRVVGGWEVWTGQKVLRNTGESEGNARDMATVLRDLRPTEWVTIGGARPVVEYGLTNGRPAVTGAAVESKDAAHGGAGGAQAGAFGAPAATGTAAKFVQPIDLRSARVEAIRGAWVVRDDSSILLNFGPDKAGAEQASAVIQRYGFNRVGAVGAPAQPAMSYLFVSLDPVKPQPGAALMLQAQIDGLARTGVPVPGVGFVGEMVKIDARRVEVRKDGADWVVASGPEVLGRFGPIEWAAREAARTVQDGKFTEFCKLGGESGVTFFLVNGKAPGRAPYNAQGHNFDGTALKVQSLGNNRWAVTEGGRQLMEVGSAQEGETVARVLRAYGFDQTAHLTAGGSKGGITYFVKNGR